MLRFCSRVYIESIYIYMSILYHWLNGHQEIATGHPRGGGSGLF